MNTKLRGILALILTWGGTTLSGHPDLWIMGILMLSGGGYNIGVLTAMAEANE